MKNVLLWLIIVAFGTHSGLLAQTGSFGTLPLLKKENAARLTGQKILSGAKYQRALRIYNALVNARGDRRYPVPALVMQNTEQRVALMNYSDLEIILEEKAFDVCDAFGPDGDAALAILLGHELSHYYEKHAWRRSFVANYQDLPVALQMDSLHDDVVHETQADYLGGFLVYSAGFGLFRKNAALIDSLYKAYGMPDRISGYPSLPDRKTLSIRTTEKLERLTDVFNMANLLTAVGKYGEAYLYYKYVLQEYQSRELYNNVGVTAVLEAMPFVDTARIKLYFPLELDLEATSSRGADTNPAYHRRLLQEAIRHFNTAISMDPDYAPAYLNMACAYLLLGDEERAQFYAGVEARQAAQRSQMAKVASDVDVLLAILAARRGDLATAQTLFQGAADKGNALAAQNLNILLGKRVPAGSVATRGDNVERIGMQSIYDIANAPSYDDSMSVHLEKGLDFHQNAEASPDKGRLFISFHGNEYTYSLFLLTNPGYTGTTSRGIGRGAGQAEIEEVYGSPKSRLQTPLGQILVYPTIVFVLGPENTLDRWILYLLDQG